MAVNIVTPKDFDVSEISLADVQKNKMGGNIVYLNYKESKKLIIQTPFMNAPFGIGTYVDEKTGIAKYSIDVSYRGADEDPKVALFQKKMESLDEFLIEKGAEHSKDWFGKKQKKEVVEALYRPLVKPSKDPEKYAPTMKVKVLTKDPNSTDKTPTFNVEAYKYGKEHEKFDLNNLKKGAKIQMILECVSVWFVGKSQFGITWRLVQARVKQPDNIQGFSFVDDSDDEHEEEDDVQDDELDDTVEQIQELTVED